MSPTARELATTIVGALTDAGGDVLFGVPGGGANLELVGAAGAAGMRFVLMHGETAACIAAGVHGVLTGQPGATTVTRGPGTAAAVNGVAQATLDRAPLLLVSDTVPAAQAARVPHQRLDQRAMMRPATKWSGRIGGGDAATTAQRAVALTRRPPMGAVHLDFDATADTDAAPEPQDPAGELDPVALGRATDLLRDAERPVLLAGAEAWPWVEDVRRTVEQVAIPSFTTYQARGLVPDGSPHAAGVFTNGAIERPLVERADVILAVGLDPVEPIPAPWEYGAPVVSLLPWPLTDPYYEPAVELTGPVGPTLHALADAVDTTGWERDAAATARAAARAALRAHRSAAIGPIEAVAALDRHLPDGALVTVDAGAHMLAAVPLLTVTEPRGMLISNGLATMGFAVPAAIGAGLARRDRPVVAVTGDGGLGMVLAELETIARLSLPVTVVVFNDTALSLIEIKQGDDQGGRDAVRYHDTDFAAVAAGMGLDAVRVGDGRSLEEALRGGWGAPRVIDVRIDPGPYRGIIATTRG